MKFYYSMAVLGAAFLASNSAEAAQTKLRGSGGRHLKKNVCSTGAVEYYNGWESPGWDELHDNGWESPGLAIASTWENNGKPYVVYGLQNGSVQYYDPDSNMWTQIQGEGWDSAVANIQAQFNYDSSNNEMSYQVVVGLGNGAVMHYTSGSGSWTQLHGLGWDSSAQAMYVQWPSDNQYNEALRVVVGLEDGATEFWNGSSWIQLHGTGWSAETTAMGVLFGNTQYPQVIQGLSDGAVEYYNEGSWTELHDDEWDSSVTSMAIQWADASQGLDTEIVVGLADGSTQFYSSSEGSWTQLHDEGYSSEVVAICASTGGTGAEPQTMFQGLQDGAIEYYSKSTGWNQIKASSGTDLVGMNCVFTEAGNQIVATFADGSVEYYNSEVDGGAFQTLQGEGWNNAMYAFNAKFDTSGVDQPMIVGGLAPEPGASCGNINWKKVIKKAVKLCYNYCEDIAELAA